MMLDWANARGGRANVRGIGANSRVGSTFKGVIMMACWLPEAGIMNAGKMSPLSGNLFLGLPLPRFTDYHVLLAIIS